MTGYRQVEVASGGGFGSRRDVWWIDARLAVVGKVVRGEDGMLWLVVEVHGEASKLNLDYREASRAQLAGEVVSDVVGYDDCICD